MQLKINYTQPEFRSMSVNETFVHMLQNKQHLVARFCHQAFSKSRKNYINYYLESTVFFSELSCTWSIKWQISPMWLGGLHNICATSFVHIHISCYYNKDICIVFVLYL